MKNEYYIIAKKYSEVHYYWVMWCPDGNGYTNNFANAGLYKKDYRNGQYPVITEKNKYKILNEYDHFMIYKDDLDLIGYTQTCLMRK